MTGSHRKLAAAIAEFNETERALELPAAGLAWLGFGGPLYLSGDVRLRALAIDGDGIHWVDANLAVESAYMNHPAFEYYSDLPGGSLQPALEIWQVSLARGRFSTILGPIGDVCALLDLDVPVPFPPDNWARTYRSDQDQTDSELLSLMSHCPGIVK